MNIIIVDDSQDSLVLLESTLNDLGYKDIYPVTSANECFNMLGMKDKSRSETKYDLVLMDFRMPKMDGIEACRKIKEFLPAWDIPIIMLTNDVNDDNLRLAFEAGVTDYLTIPFDEAELLARINSTLKLKRKMDRRKQTLWELQKKHNQLQLLVSIDGLTGVANRKHFDETLDKEWRRCVRESKPLSLILMDVDYFKNYNDNYGHLNGDKCLKQVSNTAEHLLKRPGDLFARYGGEEFIAILPDTDNQNAVKLADEIRAATESLNIPHSYSKVSRYVTFSLGVASVVPDKDSPAIDLIEMADKALYQAKHNGRNRVEVSENISV